MLRVYACLTFQSGKSPARDNFFTRQTI